MPTFSVAQFLEYLNAALSAAVFPTGAVIEGEVAEYRVSQGKWIWFKLKDADAVVDCFATVWQLRQPLEDGMKVKAHGIPKVHAKSGKFSFNVDRVEMVGEGALKRAYELLRAKLQQEGLFAPERKRPLPQFPQRIGLIASKESAAYGDFLRILGNRWGGLEVKNANVAVQGRDAVAQIVGAFDWFNRHSRDFDVLVLTRGGGAMEDLHAFNSEEVCRAVFSSAIPVIVGVGHERDETLADYAADVRASTPTNCAELLVPDRRDVEASIDAAVRRMDGALSAALAERVHQVDALAGRIEAAARREITAFDYLLQHFQHKFSTFSQRVSNFANRIEADERLLLSLDPRRPLERGYALVHAADGTLVTDAAKIDLGSQVTVHLKRGMLGAKVTEKKP